MCYDDSPAVPGFSPVTVTSGDGTRFLACVAQPTRPSGARLVLLPDVNGLRPLVADLAERFAQTGATVIAIDYYGRTAGTSPRGDDFDRNEHAASLRRSDVVADVRAALDFLTASGTPADGPSYVGGFCFGGAAALHVATHDLGLSGAIAFCPWHGGIGHDPALPDDFVAGVRCPVLGLFGEADHAVPATVAAAFEAALKEAGIDHQIVVYPGQPHGFFELDRYGEDGHAEAAADAYRRVTEFLARTA